MTHSVTIESMDFATATHGIDTVYRRAGAALLALRTQYGLKTVDIAAMDRITALRVAATLEFLRNNLPKAP